MRIYSLKTSSLTRIQKILFRILSQREEFSRSGVQEKVKKDLARKMLQHPKETLRRPDYEDDLRQVLSTLMKHDLGWQLSLRRLCVSILVCTLGSNISPPTASNETGDLGN